jgi:DNA modification methylase
MLAEDALGDMPEAGQGGDEFDTTPEEGPTRSKLGDLWQLGKHRMLVGDCTDAGNVARLMGGEVATVCLTDPPYSVDYENLEREPGRVTRKQGGDAYRDPLDAGALLEGFIKLIPADVLVLTYPYSKHFHELADATRDWDMMYECHWVKNHFAYIMGRRYQPKHEPILFFRRKKAKSPGVWNVPSNQSTIFEFDKAASNPDHPTPKPIELWALLVQYQSNPGDIIYEPFCGSGTGIIAAERHNRKCYSFEIEPRYADVCIKRWEAESGETAKLLERVEQPELAALEV